MSERDYASEIDALAKRIEAIEAEAKRLNEVILDDVLHTLGDMKEVAAIERAATCGTGPNEPGVSSPAQADVGEAPAESEWPRYVQINETRIARFDGPLTESINLDNGIDHGSRGVFWREAGHYLNDGRWTMLPRAEAEARIAAARGEKPRLDDAFPIPATVEQGPTEGMRRAAVEICGHANHPSVAAIRSLLSTHIGPELAAKDAEIVRLKADNVRLKDDYQVAINNIGYREGELHEYRLEVERLKGINQKNDLEYVATCKERDAAQLDRRQLRSDLATARRELGEMKAESERLSTGYECGWCGEEFEDDEGPQSTAHAFCCEHSPVVKRIADLTAKLAEAEKELTLADTATGWWFLFWVFSLTGLTFAFSMYLTWACKG